MESSLVQSIAPPAPTRTNTQKRRLLSRFRFSLRTLLLTVLLIGSVLALVKHWDPWVLAVQVLHPNGGEAHEFFSFAPDSKRFMTRACGWNPRIRNAETGELEAIRSSNMNSSFSADGKHLALFDYDEKSVLIWDVTSHTTTLKFPVDDLPADAHFSPQGLLYLEFCGENVVDPFGEKSSKPVRGAGLVVFDAATGEKKFKIALSLTEDCQRPCLSRDGKLILGVQDHGWSAWDAQSGASLPMSGTISNPKENVHQISLSPDNRFALSTSSDNSTGVYRTFARLWHLKPGIISDSNPDECTVVSDDSVWAAEFRPDNSIIIFRDDGFSILDIDSHKTIYEKRSGDAGFPCQSPDGNTIVMHRGDTDTLEIWHRRRPERLSGVLYLPEFWTTVLIAGALSWSLISSRWRLLRK